MSEVKPIEIHWPEYHYSGMGCGLEDRGIHDRYDAMFHGWECAVERCMEAIPDEPLLLASEVSAVIAAKDAEIAHLNSLNEDAHAVVARIWAIFGTPSYEDLAGRTIYDLVEAAVSDAARLRASMREASDLLAERIYGNPARSPSHNARVVMEYALTQPDAKSGGKTGE